MRIRNNKLINFILEFSQIMLVFLGVYSALMCTASSLDMIYDGKLCLLLLFAASIVFYGLFTVLETFRKGKLYGLIGITMFFLALVIRFKGALLKGIVSAANSFLKEFMNYTGTNVSLLSYADTESASAKFCTTLLLILIGVYFVALISAFFYRRRRSVVFLAGTIPFVVLPLVAGRIGRYLYFFTYLIVAVTIIGTRHLRTDATDRRMRQKLALILMTTCLICGGIFYLFIPPSRYDRNVDKLSQAKNSLVALSTWDGEDIMTWLKAYFNGDAISYGKIGKKSEVSYTSETMLKISGDINSDHGLYLKGYVGDVYENNKWSSICSDENFKKDWKALDATGVTTENWHTQLRNELGDEAGGGLEAGTLDSQSFFGYGNFVPCLRRAYRALQTDAQAVNRVKLSVIMLYICGRGMFYGDPVWQQPTLVQMRLSGNLSDFAKKYYLQIPDSMKSVCEDFKKDCKSAGLTKTSDIILEAKSYITKDTTYSLSPGKTPSGKESIEYFLKENKKGYCTYYATAAVMLLRSMGIPARYVEGMYVSKDELAAVKKGKELEVPDEDAHAWVEVFDEKYGFVTVEVTPGKGEDDMTGSDSSNENTNPNQTSNGAQTDSENPSQEDAPNVATPTPSVTQEPEESMVFDDIKQNDKKSSDSGNANGTSKGRIWFVILDIVIVLLLIAAAMEAQRRIRAYMFRKNMKQKKAKRRIRMVYLHLFPVFHRYKLAYRGQSMAQFSREISREMELPFEDVLEFVTLIFHARFGPDTITEDQLREFKRVYHEIRAKAYRDAKPMRKLYYMYIMVL
ncbi:MAG: transglutaminase-like domain-containing protein [Clostridium sp.]